MPSWWEELTKIPSHADHKEFAQKVCTSFKVPKACSWVKKVDNYHAQPQAHPSNGKHHFLPSKDVTFGTQDICLAQLQHTITYARALQHLAEEVHPQSPANFAAWQGVYRSSGGQWSHSSLSQEMSL